MEIKNPRLYRWTSKDARYGSSQYPFALIVDVDDCDILLRLYDKKPSNQEMMTDYSMWKGGVQFVGAYLHGMCFKDENLTDA